MDIYEIMADIIKIVKENTPNSILGEEIKRPKAEDYSLSNEAFGRVILEMKRLNLIEVKVSNIKGIPGIIWWETARTNDIEIYKLIQSKLEVLPKDKYKEIVPIVEDIVMTKDKKSAKEKYEHFVGQVANYITIASPFVSLIPYIFK